MTTILEAEPIMDRSARKVHPPAKLTAARKKAYLTAHPADEARRSEGRGKGKATAHQSYQHPRLLRRPLVPTATYSRIRQAVRRTLLCRYGGRCPAA